MSNEGREIYTEEKIISVVKQLLSGRVNELLGEVLLHIPLVEFSDYEGRDVIVPVISLSSCEQSEKERIIRLDAYSMTVTFLVPETSSLTEPAESELYCYAYSAAFCKAVDEDVTLGGVVDRAIVTGKKYVRPKAANCGDDWQVVVMLRITNEQ